MSNIIKFKGSVNYQLWPKPPVEIGDNDNSYGIVKWDVQEIIEGEYDEPQIVVVGNYFNPINSRLDYTISCTPEANKKYGLQYNLQYIVSDFVPTDASSLKAFLRSFMTPGQIKELYTVHPDPKKILDERNVEELIKVKGIGNSIANRILRDYHNNLDTASLYMELSEYDLSPNMIEKLLKTYKTPEKAIYVIRNDPYQLIDDMTGVGFIKADTIALKGGMLPTSPDRVAAYIVYTLKSYYENNGDSYITAGELNVVVLQYFGEVEYYYDEEGNVTGNNFADAIQQLERRGKIVVEESDIKNLRRVYLTQAYNLEHKIAENLVRILKAPNKFKYKDWKEKIAKAEKEQGFEFDEVQKSGIKLCLDSQLCLISGLAGSGSICRFKIKLSRILK